jgi:lipopolysaccharide export system protein LptA
MRWQKTARLAIAGFVIVFAAFVFVAMRRGRPIPRTVAGGVVRTDDKAISEDRGATYEYTKKDKTQVTVTWKRRLAYPDGRSRFHGFALTLPDREGRTIQATSDEADVMWPPGKDMITTAVMKRNVKLTTNDGLSVSTGEATYDDTEAIVKVPGPVEFNRGRMSGKGIGATYDRNRDVLWLLDQAQIQIAPDDAGAGKIDATAASAGLARAEHYVRLSRAAHVVTDGRTIDAEELTALLTPDDKQIQMMQLRGNSRITGTDSTSQSMSAKDIDLTYGPDGRSLQTARLMDQAHVQLPGDQAAPGRAVSAKNIDMTMSPDGSTVTRLNATDTVVVELPAAAGAPARTIRSATLVASGGESAGLQTATFDGGVEFIEKRASAANADGTDRTARATRLILETKPGFGAVQQADFHGSFTFTDGQRSAEAPRAVYHIERDQIDLSAFRGDAGGGPRLSDERMTVDAANIQFSASAERLTADAAVRSVLQPQGKSGATASERRARVPAMLKNDRPVNATANRLAYERGSVATYTGSARLWQDDSRLQADTIIVDENTGNLTARGHVQSRMTLQDVDPATKQRKTMASTATSDHLVYEDDKRLATYTSASTVPARMTGPQGDVTGERLQLYLKEGGNELERFEAHNNVVVVETMRTVKGNRLVYTAADEQYVIVGTPVQVIRKSASGCEQTEAATVRFNRAVDRIVTEGADGIPTRSSTVECPERRF